MRAGLNCELSYTGRRGERHVYRVRAGDLGHGVQMVSAESVARTQRAYYPHRTANQQFSVQVLLKDWAERTHFTSWLATYASYALDPSSAQPHFPWMTVRVPPREFLQYGVPLQGYEWGAHTGMMMFTPQVVFEAAKSPGQKHYPTVSSVINKWSAFSADTAIQYFYPFGIQLAADQQGSYAQIQYPGDPTQFGGGGGGGAPVPGTPVPGQGGNRHFTT